MIPKGKSIPQKAPPVKKVEKVEKK